MKSLAPSVGDKKNQLRLVFYFSNVKLIKMELVTDKYTAFKLLEKSKTCQVLKNFSPELRDEFDIMMKAVSVHGYSLQYASERLKNNKDIVEEAVAQNKLAFKYAGNKIKNNAKFILECLDSNISTGEIFKHCSPELQKDRDFSIAFIKENSFALKYFPEELKTDIEIAMLALNTNEFAFRYINKGIRDNLDITKRALEFPSNFKYVAKKYKNDESIALLAIEKLSNSDDFPEFAELSDSLKNNKEFFKKVISKRAILLAHASENIKKDCEFLKFFFDHMQIKVDYPYTNHKELLAPHLKKNSYFFKFASEDILNDRHIILEVLKKDTGNIRHASNEIQNMLGSNKSQYVATLEKIISIEALADKLNSDLFNKASKSKVKI